MVVHPEHPCTQHCVCLHARACTCANMCPHTHARTHIHAHVHVSILHTPNHQDLDEVQTVLLLRRFAADMGTQLAPAPGAAAGGQVVLEEARVVEVGGG